MPTQKTITEQTPKAIFKQVYDNGVNFITPKVISYTIADNGNRVIELAKGEGILHNDIYGVTVCDYVDGIWQCNSKLLKLFNESNPLEKAKRYIKQLSY